MARNKNSTALFDVIHAAKKPPKASPSASIPTPRWWGKDRKDKKVPQPVPNTSENVGRQQSWLTAAKKNGVAPLAAAATDLPSIPESVSEVTYQNEEPATDHAVETVAEPVAPAAPKVRFIDRFKSRAAATAPVDPVEMPVSADPVTFTAAPVEAEMPSSSNSDSEWTDSEFVQARVQAKPEAKKTASRDAVVRIDSSAREFSFRLSYGGLIAVGFIFMMALAIAFIVGNRTGIADGESAASQKSSGTTPTAGLMAGVAPAKSDENPASKETPHGGVSPGVLKIGPGNPKPAPTGSEHSVTVTPASVELPIKMNREIGLVYVIIQSYDDQDLAEKACDFVNKNSDIQCTVVQGPADWAPHSWYSVIGLRPFSKHDPALPDYELKIKKLGAKFSSNVLNQFTDPRAYTWRGDSEAAGQ